MDIKALLSSALTDAARTNFGTGNTQEIHRKRSAKFVEMVASHFRETYKGQSSIFVLSRDSDAHKTKFGVNELLFDILVCQTNVVLSSVQHKELTFISDAIWQIESEFAKDSQQAIYDFNKLVIGNAPNKLFIGPIVNDNEAFIQTLRAPARHCSGSVLLALVTHPADWEKKDLVVLLWKFIDDGWQQI